jgi:urease gamma subunit
MNSEFDLKPLPPIIDLDSVKILKKVNTANKALAELKGITKTIPNSGILINTLVLQEAKDSSAIENIITTHDELFKADLNIEKINFATKEVQDYSYALKKGFELVETNQILVTRYIVEIQEILESNKAGIRKQAGTALKNGLTGEVIYTPPQNFDEISSLMKNLEDYINTDDDDIDYLIKMAIIHYQFGGGAGMVMMCEPIDLCISKLKEERAKNKADREKEEKKKARELLEEKKVTLKDRIQNMVDKHNFKKENKLSKEAAAKAINELNGSEFMGRQLVIKEALPKRM